MKHYFFFLGIFVTMHVNAQVTCTTTDPILINDVNSGNTSVNFTLKLDGISGYSLSNQLLGSNSSPDALEWKSLTPGTSGSDFNIAFSAGAITFNLPDAGASSRGVVNTSGTGQTFAGPKTFTGDLTVSGTNTNLFLPDGLENAPSLSFSSNTNGSGFSYTNSTKTVFLSLDGSYNFQFLKGQLDITSGADFIGGANHLNINIAHLVQSAPNDQDGGISVSTYANGTTHTCTFAGRTANGTEAAPTQSLLNDRLAEFSGKGFYSDGAGGGDWDPSNRVVFGAYAAENHTTSNQGAFCAISTTAKGDNTNHISMIIDDKGNAGLTDQKYVTISLPTNFGPAKSDRFFSIQTTNNSKDVGIFLQSKTADKGMNIWLDNSLSKTFLDNIENTDAAIVQIRMKAYSGATSPVITMTSNGYGTNFGGGTPSSGQTFSVGSSSEFVINSTGKISKYPSTTIGNGDLLIGNSGSFDKGTITASNGTKVSNGAGTITLETDINALTADATPDRSSDYIMTYDASATANKKVLLNNFTGVVATVDLTNQNASIVATTIYTVPSAGMYRVSFNGKVTTTATTSSIIGPFQFKYTSNDDGVVATGPSNNTNGINQSNNNSLTTSIVSGSYIVYAQSGSAIQYIMGYSSAGATAMIYSLHIKVEAL